MQRLLSPTFLSILAAALLLLGFACPMYATPNESESVPFNGLVVDMLGKPIRGVRVHTIDRRYYTTSDRQGRFHIRFPWSQWGYPCNHQRMMF